MQSSVQDPALQGYGKCTIVHKNNIISYGGYNGKERLNSIFVYDTIQNQITSHSLSFKNENLRRDCGCCNLYENKMVIVGGGCGHEWYNQILCYDLFTGQVSEIIPDKSSNIPSKRAGAIGVVYENKFYIMFGWDGQRALNDVWYFDFKKNTWHEVKYKSNFEVSPRDSCGYVRVKNAIYIFGGGIGKKRFNEILKFNILSSTFEKINIPTGIELGLAGCSCDYYNDHIYIYGGGNGETWNKLIFKFNVNSNFFETVKINNVQGGYSPSMKIVNGVMYIFGGGDGKNFFDTLSVIKIDDTNRELNMKKKVWQIEKLCDVGFIYK